MPNTFPTFLLLAIIVGPLTSPKHPDNQKIEHPYYFAKCQDLLLQLSTDPTTVNYDSARHAWEQISWLFPVAPQAEGLPPLDNNYRWVLADPGHNYPEAGAWQRLEMETGRFEPDLTIIRRQTTSIITYLQALQHTLDRRHLPQEDIHFLLATEIYRQYNLTLSGHHRLNRDLAVDDFVAFLTGLQKWSERLDLFDQTGNNLLESALRFCRGTEFADLDRYTLYQQYLRPLYRSLLKDLPVENLANRYSVAATAGGELFSLAFMDPVTVEYPTTHIALGELLFFDPLLSGNGRRSCASCHQPSRAYADGRITSMAFDYPNRIKRNAPSLINATTGHGAYGADLAKPSVGHFIQSVFDHPQEMNVRMDSIVNRLNSAAGYRNAFGAAFPGEGIDSANVLVALEAFITNLNGVDASFDRKLRTMDTPPDTAMVRGYNLFAGKGNCGSCHFPPYFDGRKPPYYRKRNYQSAGRLNHLTDLGLGDALQDDRYNYFFRVSGIRNLSYSAPYGHDGYFITLRGFTEDHHGVEQLTSPEMTDLLHFMSTLNDSLKLIDEAKIILPRIDHQTTENRRPAGFY